MQDNKKDWITANVLNADDKELTELGLYKKYAHELLDAIDYVKILSPKN